MNDNTLLEEALRLQAAGFQLAGIGVNKAPTHEQGFTRRPVSEVTAEAIEKVRQGKAHGVRVELGERGAVPGLGIPIALEAEGRAEVGELASEFAQRLGVAIENLGVRELYDRVYTGVRHATPSGGWRAFAFLRLEAGQGMPSARPARWLPRAPEDRGKLTLAELLTSNAIVAPSGGHAHPTGRPWGAIVGHLSDSANVPTISLDEYDALALLMDELSDEGAVAAERGKRPEMLTNVTPESRTVQRAYKRDATATQVLQLALDAGWTVNRGELPGTVSLCRPGSTSRDQHATIKGEFAGMTVWTTSSDLAQGYHDAFELYAALRHSRDATLAASAIAGRSTASLPRAIQRPEVYIGDLRDPLASMTELIEVAKDATSASGDPLLLQKLDAAGFLDGVLMVARDGSRTWIDESNATGALARVARLVNARKKSKDAAGEEIEIPQYAGGLTRAQRDLANAELRTAGALRAVRIVSDAPVILPDGTTVSEPGYDAEHEVFVAIPPRAAARWAEEYRVPNRPTQADAQSAADLLVDELLADFPFSRTGGKAAALATMLAGAALGSLRVVRGLGISAPDPGTGKTLLAEVIRLVSTGSSRFGEVSPYARDSAETMKELVAYARAGLGFVGTDNVATGSKITSTVATRNVTHGAGNMSARILGGNTEMFLPAFLWTWTGNAVRFGGDFGRRVLLVELEVPRGLAWERSGFRHADLLGFVRENRPRLLAALHTIIKFGRQNVVPHEELRFREGGFEDWENLVVQGLHHVRIDGKCADGLLLEDRAEFLASSNEVAEDWAPLLEWWSGLGRRLEMKALYSSLWDSMNAYGRKPNLDFPIPEALEDAVRGRDGDAGAFKKMGLEVSKVVGTKIPGDKGLYILRAHQAGGKSKRSNSYFVEFQPAREDEDEALAPDNILQLPVAAATTGVTSSSLLVATGTDDFWNPEEAF